VKLQLGVRLTAGLGAGANPDVGRRAALEDSEKIIEALEGADMVFVTAGLGGGTGTGAAPVIASLASEMGILTVAVITQPFAFEGKRRLQQAERGLKELLESVDTMIVIPNEKLLAVAKDAGFFESFRIADDVLRQGVQGISDIITIPGIINRDFADVKTTMAGMGHAVMGTAIRSGENRAIEAADAAMASPLLEAGAIDGARGILINITGSSALRLSEVNAASSLIQEAAHEDANIIFGAVLDEKMGDEVKITVIATGFRDQMPDRRARMLTVEESPVISVPVLSSETWMREPGMREPISVSVIASQPMAGPAPQPVMMPAPVEVAFEPEPELQPAPVHAAPPPPRFMSEAEEMEEPVVARGRMAAGQAGYGLAVAGVGAAGAADNHQAKVEREMRAFDELFADTEPIGAARPRFAELSEEPAFKQLPRDFACDLSNGIRPAIPVEQPVAAAVFADKRDDMERDLDVPAFMRRMQF
jgi:cell division protein FtsZ